MAMFFTSDLHLGHANVLPIRPQFSCIEEHDDYLIDQWNSKVTRRDEVYILGDFSFRAEKPVAAYLSRLKGKKHLIIGNHDGHWMKQIGDLGEYFVSVEQLHTMKFQKKQLTLCHYPMLEWPGSRYAAAETSFLIHGHIHNLTDTPVFAHIRQHQPHALNAGVEINDFAPVTFEELLENNRRWYGR